jgi:hypothetical protein
MKREVVEHHETAYCEVCQREQMKYVVTTMGNGRTTCVCFSCIEQKHQAMERSLEATDDGLDPTKEV